MKTVSMQFLVVCMLFVTGCAGTGMKVESAYKPTAGAKVVYQIIPAVAVTDEALAILRARLDTKFAQLDLTPATPADASVLVEVSIANYYMRHGAVRAMVGVMAGADNMQSHVVVRDARTKSVLGTFSVESTNPTALGSSRGMIENHADEIADYVRWGSK